MFTFATFCPDSIPFCPCGVPEDSGDAGVNICRLVYSEDATNDTHPPPIWGAKTPFTPIIFRTKNMKKSHLERAIIFRTKNTAKSRLGLIGKNFGKNLRENVSGEENAPNLVERGRGVLKYERIVWAKIVELFGNARG